MIENVELINFISHKETPILLENGVNVFIGANGAGKSSVIDAITYALYGEHTRDASKNILRRGAAEGSVSVKFSVAGRKYLAERKFGRAGKLEAATFRELAPNARLIVAGERRQFEESMSGEVAKVFGLDYEKMKVAAIVQQGELDAIIKYKPKELKELLNSLIGIDKLDNAFENMRAALDGFRLRLRAECMNYDDQSMEAVREEIRSATQIREESETNAQKASAKLSELEQEREGLAKDIEAMEPLRTKRAESEERKGDLIRYVEKTASHLDSEEKKLAKVIDKAEAYLSVLISKPLIESESIANDEEEGRLGTARTQLTSDLRSARNAAQHAETIEKEIRDGLANIQDLEEKIQKRRSEISRLKLIEIPTKESAEQLNLRLQQVKNSVDEFKENLIRIDDVLENYKRIRVDGVCPTCGSTVEEINLDSKLASKHKEHTEAREKVKTTSLEQDSVGELLKRRKEYDAAQKDLRGQLELLSEYTDGLKTEKGKLASRRKDVRARLAESRKEPVLKMQLASVKSKLGELAEKKRSLRERQSSLTWAEAWLSENKIATKADIEERQRELTELQAKIRSIPKDLVRADSKSLAIDEYSSQLAAMVISLEEDASRFDETAYRNAKSRLEEEILPAIKRMNEGIGGWKQKGKDAAERVSKLEQAKAKLVLATTYVRLFEKIRGDIYSRDGILATSLRSWALKELSKSASEYIRSFGIGLSELQLKEQKHDVNIECYSASGMTDVKSMSGGESVAIALALRFAMSRLMGKGMVDFIALDEPTTHLDEERRRLFVRLVTEFNSDEKRSLLNQIIVITHDREIFEDSEVNAVFQFQKIGDVTTVTKS
jgi:DNA repair protein SbcC/Rad50